MNTEFYKIQCITNLYVGSGDINYSIVDNQVEKDAVTGLPVIHASGIKGALRDVTEKEDRDLAKVIFGSAGEKDQTKEGSHKFFDAILLTRPMRVSGSDHIASIPVTTIAAINLFIERINLLNCNTYGINKIEEIDFAGNTFLTNSKENISVEGDATGVMPEAVEKELLKIKNIIGDTFAIVTSFDGYDLPVVARNHLVNKKSENLWYEEVVPHGSVFYFAVISPDEVPDDAKLTIPEIVQFGGHSTIGCGFTKVTKL